MSLGEELNLQNIHGEVEQMLNARGMKYSQAVTEYFKKYPKDESKKKTSDDAFVYANCIERKYWNNVPKNRIGPAIFFLTKLKKFLKERESDDPKRWIVENLGQDVMDSFRREVLHPLEKEEADKKYRLPKNSEGKDEFDF